MTNMELRESIGTMVDTTASILKICKARGMARSDVIRMYAKSDVFSSEEDRKIAIEMAKEVMDIVGY